MNSDIDYATTHDANDHAPEVATEKPPRERVKSDAAAGTVTVGDAVYSLDAIPSDLHRALALRGLAFLLATSPDRLRLYDAMRAGRMTLRATGKPKEVSPWHRAIAAAIVEEAKKAGAPLALEDALVKAQGFPAAKLRESKAHPAVVKHYARITGASVSLLD